MTVTPDLTVRVWVEDVWDTVVLTVSPDWTVGRLKEEALARAQGTIGLPNQYEVKFRGARVLDERSTLADLEVPANAALIVLAAGRRPVR